MSRLAGFFFVIFCLVGVSFGVAALVFPSEADAQTAKPGTVQRTALAFACASTTCDGSTPTLSTDGAPLGQATAARVRLCADSAETLSGAGNLLAYVRDESDGLWTRAPALDKTVTTAVDGERCVTFFDSDVGVSYGRVSWVPFQVTLSGGDLAVTVYAAATAKR